MVSRLRKLKRNHRLKKIDKLKEKINELEAKVVRGQDVQGI